MTAFTSPWRETGQLWGESNHIGTGNPPAVLQQHLLLQAPSSCSFHSGAQQYLLADKAQTQVMLSQLHCTDY